MSGTAAILLAAGRSRRMGTCKQLLPLGDSTVIGRCLETLLAGGASEIVVVVSEEGEAVADAIRDYPVRFVINTNEYGDMASSIRAGRDALAPGSDGVLVALCDYPLVLPETVSSLLECRTASPAGFIIPRYEGRNGHPLVISRELLNELTAGLTLRDIISANRERVVYLDTADPGILIDMDTPEDYRRILTYAGNDSRDGQTGDCPEDRGWEDRCRQCGACCFEKIENERGTIFYTRIPCRYLEVVTRRCRIYENRFSINPECVKLTEELVATLRWLPPDCGYRNAADVPVPVDRSHRPGRRQRRRS